MRKITKSKKLIAGAVAAAAVSGGVAYAYWTSGGAGSASGTTDAELSALVVNQTNTLSAMFPGDSAQTLSGNFDNPNDGPVFVGTVTASIASVLSNGEPAPACSAADFTLAGAAMTVAAEVPPGTAKGSWSGATIKFNNTGTNQDGCKDVTVNLAYAIS